MGISQRDAFIYFISQLVCDNISKMCKQFRKENKQ